MLDLDNCNHYDLTPELFHTLFNDDFSTESIQCRTVGWLMNDDELGRIWKEAGSRESSIVIGTSYGLDYRGSIPGSGKASFSIPQRPDQLCGPPSHLSNGYRSLLPGGKATEA
jgi:hypothetical protein